MVALHAVPQRIAIFRALQLGDMLCSVPALRALRRAYPAASITLIGLPWARTFVARYASLIDDLMVFPGAVGFPEQAENDEGLPALFAEARARRFDLALQMHGSGGVANDILFGLGARAHGGFVQPAESRSGTFIPWPERLPEPARYTALIEALGIAAGDESLWLPLDTVDRAEAAALLERHAHGRNVVIIHAGAQLPSRRWPAARFARVADAAAAAGRAVFLTGTAAEAPLVDTVQEAMSHGAVSVAGETTLGGVAALVERAELVVCNDTGISHIAAALATPSVVIACGSDTRRWAPADRSRHRVLAAYPECRPCMHASCPVGHICALEISPEAVISAVRERFSMALPPPNQSARGRARLAT